MSCLPFLTLIDETLKLGLLAPSKIINKKYGQLKKFFITTKCHLQDYLIRGSVHNMVFLA